MRIKIVQLYVVGLLCLLFGLQPVSAEQVDGLYTVAVPVSSQSSSDFKSATRAGLKTVFTRISGQTELGQQLIQTALSRANSYTRKYRYETFTGLDNDSSANEQLLAVIEFEPLLVDQILRQAGLPFWSSNRPTVLVWIVVEDADGRRFVSAERDADIVQAITNNATRRGLAIKLPALDLEDMVAVSTDDVWQLNNRRAIAASERYQADTVLFGRVSKLTNGEWLGRWSYRYDQQPSNFDGQALNANNYVALALDHVAKLLARQYAIAPVNIADNGVLMRLTGIEGFVDYARAINYLESVAAIRHANVVSVTDDEIIVRLVADGLLIQLEQSFLLDKRLAPQTLDRYQGNYLIDLDYRWPQSEVKTNSVNTDVPAHSSRHDLKNNIGSFS
jgi:hypothetical protein